MRDSQSIANRVIAYVDGFNLYFGLKESGWRRYYWLDIHALVANILPPGSSLLDVKYFTARVDAPEGKRVRQNTYLEALQAATACKTVFGKYQPELTHCSHCGGETRIPKEKMTDVNIAVEMMADAFDDRFDTAMLVSGDSDLTPPVRHIRHRFPGKRVVVAFPPKRHSIELERASSGSFVIARSRLRDSQLPDAIAKPDGYILRRPERWR